MLNVTFRGVVVRRLVWVAPQLSRVQYVEEVGFLGCWVEGPIQNTTVIFQKLQNVASTNHDSHCDSNIFTVILNTG
jgi:hypothetical protein